MYEYWLPHFKACVVEGQAQSVMASYNADQRRAQRRQQTALTDVLRGQWGFQGFVVSDLGGVQVPDRPAATSPTTSRAKPSRGPSRPGATTTTRSIATTIPVAVKQGLLTEAEVNTALARVLRVGFRLGAFDPQEDVPFSKIPAGRHRFPPSTAIWR